MSFRRCDWLFPPSAREVSAGNRSNYKSTRERVDSKGLYGRWRLHLMGSCRFLTHFSIFSFFAKNRKTEKWKKSYLFAPFFPLCPKDEKIEKLHNYRPIFHNSILIRKMKIWQVLREIFYFSFFFLINRKTLKRYTFSDSFSFSILSKNGAEELEVINILTVMKRIT